MVEAAEELRAEAKGNRPVNFLNGFGAVGHWTEEEKGSVRGEIEIESSISATREI